jgi:hypothetical protein
MGPHNAQVVPHFKLSLLQSSTCGHVPQPPLRRPFAHLPGPPGLLPLRLFTGPLALILLTLAPPPAALLLIVATEKAR